MPKLRVGVIGTGSIGDVHLMGYKAQPKLVSIQALCDPTADRLAAMGEKYGVPKEHCYPDHESMLANEKLDAVSVCVPNAYHFPIAMKTLALGIPTLLEKPMVLTNQQAREISKLVARKKVKFMVAFSHRFSAINTSAKKILDKGGIGKPFMIRVRFAHGGPYPGWAQSDWFYNKKIAGGGALLDMGIHAIDICHYLIGPIKSVQAQMSALRKKIEVDDNAVMLLDFGPAKCLGYIEVGWTSGAGYTGSEIYGDDGSLILDYVNGPKHVYGVNKPDGTIETTATDIDVTGAPANWMQQMETWSKYVAGMKLKEQPPGAKEGASSLAVALAAMESSRTGKRVKTGL
jgi:UDP-N-acetylglucosamine 3-dehydrogenase